jgi:MFS transporter, ACS family, aldohexuronate transporter
MNAAPRSAPATSHVRWTICALLFFASTINYVDRQVLSLLAKTLQNTIGWTDIEYSNITSTFTAFYAAGMLGTGRLLDKYGARLGFAVAVIVWSVAAMAHAAATSAFTFGIARAFLGLGEAANFPASIKIVAQWFPKKERAQATGIFNAGTNVGAAVAALIVPWLALRYGWQAAFIFTGAVGFVWLLFWIRIYDQPEKHRGVSSSELKHIQSDPPDKVPSYPWIRLFPHRETWTFAIGKFMTDGVWWFYLFWLPKYLQEAFGLTLAQVTVPTIAVYVIADIGSVGGGWLSSTLIRRGWSINAARKLAMLVCGLAVMPVIAAPFTSNMWIAVALVSLAAAAHQGWSANLFTTSSDMFPRSAVGSVVGIGAACGALGGVLVQKATGYVVTWTQSYFLMFLFCGCAYVIALAMMHLLSPKLAPAELD